MSKSKFIVEYDIGKWAKRISLPDHIRYMDQITCGFWVDGHGEYSMNNDDSLYFVMPYRILYIENTDYTSL